MEHLAGAARVAAFEVEIHQGVLHEHVPGEPGLDDERVNLSPFPNLGRGNAGLDGEREGELVRGHAADDHEIVGPEGLVGLGAEGATADHDIPREGRRVADSEED